MIGLIRNAMLQDHKARSLCSSLFAKSDLGIEGIEFDLLIDESHGLDFQLSEHPIQDGNVIVDHVMQKLRTCKITGLLTNHPARKVTDKTEIIDVKEEKLDTYKISNSALRKYNALEDVAKAMSPVRLVTSLVTYPKMIITSIKTSRGPKDGESIKFTMTLKEYRYVKLLEVSADYVYSPSDMKDATNQLIAPQKNGGLKAGVQKKVTTMLKEWGLQQ